MRRSSIATACGLLAAGLSLLTGCGGLPPQNPPKTEELTPHQSPVTSSRALVNGVPLTGLSGSWGSQALFTLEVPAGAGQLVFTLGTGTSSSNDADLYVRFGSAPTLGSYDCRSWATGLTESCAITPVQAGTYYVLVSGYSAYSDAVLTGSSPERTPHPPAIAAPPPCP